MVWKVGWRIDQRKIIYQQRRKAHQQRRGGRPAEEKDKQEVDQQRITNMAWRASMQRLNFQRMGM